jgi:iron complex transport system ATP-binding protein
MAVSGGGTRLATSGLRVRLGGAEVLAGVDLTVRAGELLAVIGPNGAGKSTLLRSLDGLQGSSGGTVEVDGRPVSSMRRRELARLISFVPQTDVPADGWTVRAFVEMGRYPHLAAWSALTAEDRRAVDEALDLTETGHLVERVMKTLSGGERQRVWIAAALAQGGTILLLDEPTSFLDYRHQVQVLDLLGRLHAKRGYTVVAVTHDLNGLVADADSVVALVDGRVGFSGPPLELFDGAVLSRIFGSDFVLIEGGRRGLPLVMPARNGS